MSSTQRDFIVAALASIQVAPPHMTLQYDDALPTSPPPPKPKPSHVGEIARYQIIASSAGKKDHTGTRISAETNVPDRFELFLLKEGEKKVEEKTDTRVPSCSIFTFNKEDHTLANLIRERLLSDKSLQSKVLFAAYKVPHPLFATFDLRIQTDGSITPKEALMLACRGLVTDLGSLSREFTKEWELRKMAGAGAGMNGV
ncbi:DNA-directed RNA polymerase II core subunit [Agyrium rufum]|nr:DNA-directed RNA polymerase II core subunit [Agyrium rufum]